MRPAVAALADQADAAGTEAARIMHTLARLDGTEVQHVRPGPVFAALIARLPQRMLAGQITLCPHLSYTAPEPSFWCVWAPGRLRCAHCTEAAQRRIRGTAEDRRCDACRKTGPKIHPDMAQLPPIVVDLPSPWPPRCVPPITVLFGLCPDCQRTDESGRS